MIHICKLWKSGNSKVVVIPEKILKEAGIDLQSSLRVSAEGVGVIKITKVVWSEMKQAANGGKGNGK